MRISGGKLARFDTGFIGPGNSEISKDKLTRYAREAEAAGGVHRSVTFIVVDRLPATSKTQKAAERLQAEIIQMSMQYWPRELAQRLGKRMGLKHPLQSLPDREMHRYLAERLATIPVQEFLSGISVPLPGDADELPDAEEEIEATADE